MIHMISGPRLTYQKVKIKFKSNTKFYLLQHFLSTLNTNVSLIDIHEFKHISHDFFYKYLVEQDFAAGYEFFFIENASEEQKDILLEIKLRYPEISIREINQCKDQFAMYLLNEFLNLNMLNEEINYFNFKLRFLSELDKIKETYVYQLQNCLNDDLKTYLSNKTYIDPLFMKKDSEDISQLSKIIGQIDNLEKTIEHILELIEQQKEKILKSIKGY